MAHIMKRTIIVYADEYVHGVHSEQLQKNDIGGIYIPFLIEKVSVQPPILITFRDSHYTALMPVTKGPYNIPITLSNGKIPKLQFVRDESASEFMKLQILKRYIPISDDLRWTWSTQYPDIIIDDDIQIQSLRSNSRNVKKGKKPEYSKIKRNKIVSKVKKCYEYNQCNCKPDDPEPCDFNTGCHNATTNFECDPKQCPAKENCLNQHFRKGLQFKLKIEPTNLKGFGLFAKQDIPANQFVIEYVGEVINKDEFDKRMKTKKNNAEKLYFLELGDNLYIDADKHGNEARFINHSCDPNVEPVKWLMFFRGFLQRVVGFFSLKQILTVS